MSPGDNRRTEHAERACGEGVTLTCRTPSSTSRVSPQNPALNPALIGQLATGDWVCQSRPLCLTGDSGTGKTHLLIDPGTAAGERGHSVRYVLAAKLVKKLAEIRRGDRKK